MNNDIQLEKIRLAKEIAKLWSGPDNKWIRKEYRGNKAILYTLLCQLRNGHLITYSRVILADVRSISELGRPMPIKIDLPVKEESGPTAQLRIDAVVEFSPAHGEYVLKQGANKIVVKGVDAIFLSKTNGGMIASPITVSFIPAPKTFSGKFGKTWSELSLIQQRYIEELENKVGLK